MFIRAEKLTKRFGNKTVIYDMSFSVEKGEFHVLLGPSGEGKSVLLNLIAGLLRPESGKIYIDDNDVTKKLPENRPVSMVFQDYALFPHLSVRDNIAYGMKTRKKSRSYINEKVDEYLGMVDLEDKADKKPHMLSGGQKQRTAIARALAAEPEIILFDEPLSHLDLTLQEQLLGELKELHRKTKTTIIYVTHNRNEALALADKITLLHDGVIEQSGTAEEIFYHPRTSFAASFVGADNIIDCTVSNDSKDNPLLNAECGIELAVDYYPMFSRRKNIRVCIHPEKIVLKDYPEGDNCFRARVIRMENTNVLAKIELDLDGLIINAKVPRGSFGAIREDMYVCFERNSITPLCGKSLKQDICDKNKGFDNEKII